MPPITRHWALHCPSTRTTTRTTSRTSAHYSPSTRHFPITRPLLITTTLLAPVLATAVNSKDAPLLITITHHNSPHAPNTQPLLEPLLDQLPITRPVACHYHHHLNHYSHHCPLLAQYVSLALASHQYKNHYSHHYWPTTRTTTGPLLVHYASPVLNTAH
jgi:hypothetical protein